MWRAVGYSLGSFRRPPAWRRAGGRIVLADRHRAGVSAARPRSKQQQQPGLDGCDDLVPLARCALDEQPGAPARALAGRGRNLDLAAEHDQPRAFVNLVLREALTSREVEHDRPGCIA